MMSDLQQELHQCRLNDCYSTYQHGRRKDFFLGVGPIVDFSKGWPKDFFQGGQQ